MKPSNVLLQNGVQRVKITDFGLARAVDDIGITRTGEVAGTPQYMSPEQAQGHAIDPRSDLFSLGSVLYAMCTGRSPFRADSAVAALRRVCDDIPQPIREINPDTPDWLTAIIDRLLEKDPTDRIQTATEVAELLGKHLAQLQSPSTTPFPGTIEPTKCPTSPALSEAGSSRRWLVAGVILLLLATTLSVTEATGVTQLTSTVIRLATGEGTLVIEVDDPSVEVSLDGEELSITGAGLKEIKLRPGPHQFQATKDGEPVKTELVLIHRGGQQVVRVTREVKGAVPTVSTVTEKNPFIVLNKDGRAIRRCDTAGRCHHRFERGRHNRNLQQRAVRIGGSRHTTCPNDSSRPRVLACFDAE